MAQPLLLKTKLQRFCSFLKRNRSKIVFTAVLIFFLSPKRNFSFELADTFAQWLYDRYHLFIPGIPSYNLKIFSCIEILCVLLLVRFFLDTTYRFNGFSKHEVVSNILAGSAVGALGQFAFYFFAIVTVPSLIRFHNFCKIISIYIFHHTNYFIINITINFIIAFGEELLFRSYILTKLRSYLGEWLGLIFTALLFILWHQGNNIHGIIYLFPFAIQIGLLYLITENLWTCIAMHFAFNISFISTIMLWLLTIGYKLNYGMLDGLLDGDTAQIKLDKPTLNLLMLLSVCIVQGLLMLLLIMVYLRKNRSVPPEDPRFIGELKGKPARFVAKFGKTLLCLFCLIMWAIYTFDQSFGTLSSLLQWVEWLASDSLDWLQQYPLIAVLLVATLVAGLNRIWRKLCARFKKMRAKRQLHPTSPEE